MTDNTMVGSLQFTLAHADKPLLTIQPDGTILRASDNKPIDDLSREELAVIFRALVDLWRATRPTFG